MKAVILNGSLKDQNNLMLLNEILEKELKNNGWETESILLRNQDIKSCNGCFDCWKKTPGICVIHDPAREINEKIIQSHLVVYLTPLTFGGWSSELKKMLDRQLPLLPPGMMKINGETHHQYRYDRYPSILGIGFSTAKDEDSIEVEIFDELVKRNNLNYHGPKYGSAVIFSGEDEDSIQNKVIELLELVK